ncbi:Lhr family helicase [Candidatus Poriferisodalis sp.]|uniref:Lhr family helicase n=1 Tax=Candidatus Poriferisodalis sp. TaxID=3101277 RepID=UPI003B02BD9D
MWIGAGSLGPNDGRVRLYWRDEVATLAPPPDDEPDDPVTAALLGHLGERGAAFWPDLLNAAASGLRDDDPEGSSSPPLASPATSTDFSARVLAALWDLVWAGLVTNDTFAPLRTLGPRRSARRSRSAASRSSGAGRAAGSGRQGARRGRASVLTRSGPGRRPRPGRLRSGGPPSAAGRWSLTSLLREPAPSATERAHGSAQALLERHGIVTRPGVLAEGHPGGFAAAYGILRALEERGSVRRGHFVEGLGAAQFATAAAVERLRDHREGTGDVLMLGAADPAQPYGAALSWPHSGGRPSRTAGGHVVLADGVPLVMADRGGRTLHTFEHAATDLRWIDALRQALADGRLAKVELARIDATPAAEHPIHDTLTENGFTPGYRGPTLRL